MATADFQATHAFKVIRVAGQEDSGRLDCSPARARLATTRQTLAVIVPVVVGQLFAGMNGPKRADEGPGPITREAAVWLA
jgi:hypothetical protein